MSVRGARETSLRPGRLELERLAWAFGISLAIHLVCFGGVQLATKILPAWARQHLKFLANLLPPKSPPNQPPPAAEPPLMFVDVSPHQATPDAPKDAKFYSDKNSQAANPDAGQNSNVPKIDGTQTQTVKAEDTQRASVDRLQPDFRPPEQAKPNAPVGDMAMTKPDVNLRPDTGKAEQTRPRTVQEAKMRQSPQNRMVGQKMKQEGGVRRLRLEAGFDAKATPFGAYDAAFIEAVQQRWYDLLDKYNYAYDRSGRVVLQFRLNYDGRVTDMKVIEENVGTTLSLLCRNAVEEPAPYDRWPREMRLMVNKDYREIQFVFYYN